MKTKLFLITLALCFLAGCSQSPPAPANSPAAAKPTPAKEVGFMVKAKGADVPFEVKKAMVDVRTDVQEAQFSIASYDFTMEHMAANSIDRPKEDGKVRIAFSIKGELRKGDDFKNPVVAGEYSGAKLIWMDIYSGKAGESEIVNVENPKGGVTIDSVSDTEFKGSIDLTADNDVTIKGKFTAERVAAK